MGRRTEVIDERNGITAEAHTPAGARFLRLFKSIVQEQRAAEAEWITRLRREGVKAAHPDDGWVDRQRNEVMLVYPQFCDHAGEGDRIALGNEERYRIVTVKEVRWNRFGQQRLYFREEA